MRIVQIIDSLHLGGAEKLQLSYARLARRSGIELLVISLRDDRSSPIPGELARLGAQLAFLPAPRLFDRSRLQRLTRLLRRGQVDLVHTHLSYANILGAAAGRLAGVPVVATLHSAGLDPAHPAALHRLETIALRRGAQHIVAVGHAVAEAHRARLGATPVRIIQNAVEMLPQPALDERIALRRELGIDPARPLLLSVGRLSPLKGFDDLLAAFAALRRTHPGALLAIAGDGELHEHLRREIERLGLHGQALLLGARNDVPRLLAAADLYVSSSHVEGLPVSVLEAMSAGLPVVATSVGDTPRVIGGEAGLLVPPRSPQQLAEALCSLLACPERMQAYGEAARSLVQQHHSPDEWEQQMLELYREVTGASAGRRQEQQRSPQQLYQHYQVEKELAGRLKRADRRERLQLYSQAYDELYRRVPNHPQLTRKADPAATRRAVDRQLAFLRRFLRPSSVFLEVGPGDCSLSFRVADWTRQVYAVDVSAEITSSEHPPKNFTLVLSDGCSIPVPAESVDLAYSNQLMEHLHPEDAEEQLRNIVEALAPDGAYVCVTPNRVSGPHDISQYFDPVATGFHLKEYTAGELAALFRSAGFDRVELYLPFKVRGLHIPLSGIAALERLLEGLPRSLRQLIARRSPLRKAFSNVIIVGWKAEEGG